MNTVVIKSMDSFYKVYINSTSHYTAFSAKEDHQDALKRIAAELNSIDDKILLKSRSFYSELILAGADPRKFIYSKDQEFSDRLGELLYLSNRKLRDIGVTEYASVPRNEAAKCIRYTGPAQNSHSFIMVNTFIINYTEIMGKSPLADIKKNCVSMKNKISTQSSAFSYFCAVLGGSQSGDTAIKELWETYMKRMREIGYLAETSAMWELAKRDIAYAVSEAYFIPVASRKTIQEKYKEYFTKYLKEYNNSCLNKQFSYSAHQTAYF